MCLYVGFFDKVLCIQYSEFAETISDNKAFCGQIKPDGGHVDTVEERFARFLLEIPEQVGSV
jgi:hypothetical protein